MSTSSVGIAQFRQRTHKEHEVSRLVQNSLVAALLGLLVAGAASARDQIRIVGSSTVFPYTQAVAEQFSNMTGARAPIVESTGTGGGMKLFCGGIGERHPDLTGASRAMKSSEYELCLENGVDNITEALIGYDGVSIAVSRAGESDWNMTLSELFLALAAQVPMDGQMVDNPYMNWSEINADLPDIDILVYGPPPTSGTRDAFVELAMHVGCKALPEVIGGGMGKDKAWVSDNCSRMRQDGPFVEAGENDNLIVQRLVADPNAMGIFGYSFLYENFDVLKAVEVDGVLPDAQTIGDKSYPISRPLYFYTKNAHRGVIPNFQEFIEEYVSDDALGPDGYLSERGLIVLPDELLMTLQADVVDGSMMESR